MSTIAQMTRSLATRHVVICGAGVIGASIAHELVTRGMAVTVVERVGAACAASGKAGGFLALDWCDGSALGPLARKSFAMHAKLASQIGKEYGYRQLTTFAVTRFAEHREVPGVQRSAQWLDANCVIRGELGTSSTTAQVHPARFTCALMDRAIAHGARLVIGCVEAIATGGDPTSVRGVRVDGQILPTETVVIAMGPWSSRVSTGLRIPAITGIKGQSIVLHSSAMIPPHALFIDYEGESGQWSSPELFSRPGGDVYLCGASDEAPLPQSADRVEPNPEATIRLRQIAAQISPYLAGVQPIAVQACYRAIFDDGLPLLGHVPGIAGAYIATGHNCWGILNAPGTGVAMAELIIDGMSESVDLAPFDPQRALGNASGFAPTI